MPQPGGPRLSSKTRGGGGAGPFSESATALKAHVPHNGLSDHFFVAVLFLCPVLSPFCSIPVWQCNHAEESHTCQFFSFVPAIFAGTQLC